MHTGSYAEARTLLDRFIAEAMEGRGDGTDGPHLLAWVAWMEAMNGEIERATTYHGEAARTAAPRDQLNRVCVHVHGVLVNALRGDQAAARADAAVALAAGEVRLDRWVRTALAMLEHSLGDPAAAWAAVEPMVDAAEIFGIGEPAGFGFVPEAILALAALGELDRAERLLSIWDKRARRLDRALALAMGGRCRAVIAAARGDRSTADDALADALREHKRVDAPIELGRTLLVEGQLRRRQRRKADARESLEACARHLRAVRSRTVGAAGERGARSRRHATARRRTERHPNACRRTRRRGQVEPPGRRRAVHQPEDGGSEPRPRVPGPRGATTAPSLPPSGHAGSRWRPGLVPEPSSEIEGIARLIERRVAVTVDRNAGAPRGTSSIDRRSHDRRRHPLVGRHDRGERGDR